MALPDEKPIEGWKQIAIYLGKSERTVQRWEGRGLPVHRHEALGVVAYRPELDRWVADLKIQDPAPAEAIDADDSLNPEFGPRYWSDLPSRIFLAVAAVVFVGLMIVLWASAYGLAILAFCIGALFVVIGYRRSYDAPLARTFVALYMIAAMSYIASGTTMSEVRTSVINAGTLPPSPAYVFVTGLKFIPLIVLVFATWVLLGEEKDVGFSARPGWERAYILLGVLVVGLELMALAATSGDDRIWTAELPGRWTILIGSLIVLAANVSIWLAGRQCFRQAEISSYSPLFWRVTLGFLIIAFASFRVDGEHNRINRYYLDLRWPEAFRIANTEAIKDFPQLLRGPLKDRVGPDLMNLISQDAGFRATVRDGVFYKQHSDEPFQVTRRAVIYGYQRAPSSGHGVQPFVTIRFPKELADALRFESVGEDERK